jgi:hypothetical protein
MSFTDYMFEGRPDPGRRVDRLNEMPEEEVFDMEAKG